MKAPPPPPLVLVHGIYDDGQIFQPMMRYFEGRRIHCVAPSLEPSSGRLGLADLAAKLQASIDRQLGAERPIDLVGFSMGAVVSRYYLQALEGRQRTRKFFSIAAPYRGSQWARLVRGQGARELRPGSEFLARLDAGGHLLAGLTLHSYWTPLDLMIVPPTSSVWKLAENHRIWSPCHPCMLRNRWLMWHIFRVIRETGAPEVINP